MAPAVAAGRGHRPAARGGEPQGAPGVEGAGPVEGRDLPQAVAERHPGAEPEPVEQPQAGQRMGEDRRLRHRRIDAVRRPPAGPAGRPRKRPRGPRSGGAASPPSRCDGAPWPGKRKPMRRPRTPAPRKIPWRGSRRTVSPRRSRSASRRSRSAASAGLAATTAARAGPSSRLPLERRREVGQLGPREARRGLGQALGPAASASASAAASSSSSASCQEASRSRSRAASDRRRGGGRALDHHVGVDAAEAHGGDAGAQRLAGRPGLAAVRDAQRRPPGPGTRGAARSQPVVGGITCAWTARVALISPAIPAAALVWPMFALIEPIGASGASGRAPRGGRRPGR